MSADTHRVLIGACGWKHKAWLNNFYSDDLPEDWQLGFYSNEFPVVYVPASDWLDASGQVSADLDEWTEDVSESFRFILEFPASVLSDEPSLKAVLNQVKVLDKFCLGFVFQLSQPLLDKTELLSKHIVAAQEVASVCIDNQGLMLSDELQTLLIKKGVSEVRHGESQAKGDLATTSLAVTHIDGGELDMMGLRNIIEDCLSKSNEECISVLCLDGEPPSIETLRNADTLLNLL